MTFTFTDGRPPITRRVAVAGRQPVDFKASAGQGFLQLTKYLVQELGNPRGFVVNPTDKPGALLKHHSPRGTALVVPAGSQTLPLEVLPGVYLPFMLIVPAETLQRSGNDAIRILRLGAIANALQTILAWCPSTGEHHFAESRDLVHVTLILASYIREVRAILDETGERPWLFVDRGIREGHQLPTDLLRECKELLDPQSPLQRRLKEIRNDLGFHFGPTAFCQWLSSKPPADAIVLEAVHDPSKSEIVFLASVQAIADTCTQANDREFFNLATRLAVTLPYLIEAMIAGLLLNQGLSPGPFIHLDVKAVFTGRSSWAKDAPPNDDPARDVDNRDGPLTE